MSNVLQLYSREDCEPLPYARSGDDSYELAIDHTSEPIKDSSDIVRVCEFLIASERYRDNMMFIVGVNFGLRVGDLRLLKFSHLINTDNTFKLSFAILEQKTKNTRKRRKNRSIAVNDAVKEAVALYIEHSGDVALNGYMFRAEGNRGKNSGQPMNRNSIDRILKGIAADCGLTNKMSTHSLRKTFGYHQMLASGNDPRKLLLLQQMFGHSSSAQTLAYIGITADEMREAYLELNLGKRESPDGTDIHIIDIYEQEAPEYGLQIR